MFADHPSPRGSSWLNTCDAELIDLVARLWYDAPSASFCACTRRCIEAVYKTLDGVSKVVSGYAGGTMENPTYRASTRLSGHVRVWAFATQFRA